MQYIINNKEMLRIIWGEVLPFFILALVLVLKINRKKIGKIASNILPIIAPFALNIIVRNLLLISVVCPNNKILKAPVNRDITAAKKTFATSNLLIFTSNRNNTSKLPKKNR